ncbi:hypothetical protein [Aeromonas hydrophila]|uniref:hypothetical protein n=1 Tax=Aeromonas hydrophila TaxID=644 RepID=UPI000A794EEB|nr:hypothetical protein [Aeromonas hydrophila]MCP3287274.1 hypothetical protein [Aeromonas hydrophila]HAT1543978.1 hypothetical protein [Aeromonas hydrophila]HAT1554983.1 hypothetical protein [Aeromonas hydrophila]HAU4894361.1 hypothetical protein [Aeromonas hydrophila]HAU4974335.1 hypothetical protein [Aeromonas hydrophila]
MFEEHIKNIVSAAALRHTEKDLKSNHEKFVITLLGRFQLLELILKKYIDACVSFKGGDSAHLDGLEELPLGALIKRLRKVTQNNELADRIHALLEIRNKIAHNSLIVVHQRGINKSEVMNQQFEYIHANMNLHDLLEELGTKTLELYVGRNLHKEHLQIDS